MKNNEDEAGVLVSVGVFAKFKKKKTLNRCVHVVDGRWRGWWGVMVSSPNFSIRLRSTAHVDTLTCYAIKHVDSWHAIHEQQLGRKVGLGRDSQHSRIACQISFRLVFSAYTSLEIGVCRYFVATFSVTSRRCPG